MSRRRVRAGRKQTNIAFKFWHIPSLVNFEFATCGRECDYLLQFIQDDVHWNVESHKALRTTFSPPSHITSNQCSRNSQKAHDSSRHRQQRLVLQRGNRIRVSLCARDIRKPYRGHKEWSNISDKYRSETRECLVTSSSKTTKNYSMLMSFVVSYSCVCFRVDHVAFFRVGPPVKRNTSTWPAN